MKRCPQCFEIYSDRERFCELDGQRLLTNPTVKDIEDHLPQESIPRGPGAWLSIVVGAVIGSSLSALIFSVFLLTGNPPKEAQPPIPTHLSEGANGVRPIKTISAANSEPIATAEETVSPDAGSEASPDPQPVVTAVDQSQVAHLNRGPISTGQELKHMGDNDATQTVIQLTDGTTLEVDAAWEDKQGVWYRRGGLVSFVESGRVRSITARAESKPSVASKQ